MGEKRTVRATYRNLLLDLVHLKCDQWGVNVASARVQICENLAGLVSLANAVEPAWSEKAVRLSIALYTSGRTIQGTRTPARS